MTSLVGLLALAWMIFWVIAIVRRVQKKKGRVWAFSAGSLILSMIISWISTIPLSVSSASEHPITNYHFSFDPHAKPVQTDAPDTSTPTPANEPTVESEIHRRLREKHEFYADVKTSITAEKIAGNPAKYVGSKVELRCTVDNVPEKGTINALCGDGTNIVIEYADTNTLDKGQAIRVLGTVVDPASGTNAYGGSMNFPTVKAEFME